MDIIKFSGLPENPSFNLHDVEKLLLENGVDGHMFTPTSDIFCYIYDVEETHTPQTLKKLLETSEIELPKQPHFSLFYRLDVSDFKAAYLYGPGFNEYLTMHYPEIENIINISKGLSQITHMPLIAMYEGKRWALPKFQVYEKGSLIRESSPVGKEKYDPDFAVKDEQRLVDRFKNSIDNGILDKFDRLFLK